MFALQTEAVSASLHIAGEDFISSYRPVSPFCARDRLEVRPDRWKPFPLLASWMLLIIALESDQDQLRDLGDLSTLSQGYTQVCGRSPSEVRMKGFSGRPVSPGTSTCCIISWGSIKFTVIVDHDGRCGRATGPIPWTLVNYVMGILIST